MIKKNFKELVVLSLILFSAAFTPSLQAQTELPGCEIDVTRYGARVAAISRGQQIEEFNHQFEGGLAAQLISNPSFQELHEPLAQWSVVSAGASAGKLFSETSRETSMLNDFQSRCAKLAVSSVASGPVGLANGGYWGIAWRNGVTYQVSLWAKKSKGSKGQIRIALEGAKGELYAQSEKINLTESWSHVTLDMKPSGIPEVVGNNRFVIYALAPGELYFDVVTVMPPTWKNRTNGLRLDLAERLDALKMQYIQFPGGCATESSSVDTSWNWKNSIGKIENRAGATRFRWPYRNELYFGIDEYFQLCEDLGAEPVYTTSSGISEVSWDTALFSVCPLDKMQPIIDDILDLIEYCNGDAKTKWGARRIANGHAKPYNLKYIEIGNENGYDSAKNNYKAHYTMVRNAVLKKYPYIKTMFDGWPRDGIYATTLGCDADFTDDHFYKTDISYLYNKYDSIDPSNKKICIAEYANSIHGNGPAIIGNFGDALKDAAFMLGCEKNSARIWWTGYGNYAGLLDHGDFGPCIVWNDAVTNFVSPSYHMQKMLFTDNQGSHVLPFFANTPDCYWSASVDTAAGKKDILIKIANKASMPYHARIVLKGATAVSPEGEASILTGDLESENSIKYPDKITPQQQSFEAGQTFFYTLPVNSIHVLRIHLIH